jgi:hypothetical protein
MICCQRDPIQLSRFPVVLIADTLRYMVAVCTVAMFVAMYTVAMFVAVCTVAMAVFSPHQVTNDSDKVRAGRPGNRGFDSQRRL